MSQVSGPASPENSSSLHDESGWQTQRSRKNRQRKNKQDGRRGSASGATLGAASLTGQRTLEGNLKEDVHGNSILKILQKENYVKDFHGCTLRKALEDLEDIIMSLTHNMKGTEQYFTLITGKGIHSINGIPKIKIYVLGYLKRNHIEYKIQEKNSGRIDIIV